MILGAENTGDGGESACFPAKRVAPVVHNPNLRAGVHGPGHSLLNDVLNSLEYTPDLDHHLAVQCLLTKGAV